ncbi:MAG: hypothetical protein ACRCW1_02440 [Anaerotignaceae bacterium]
MDYKKSYTMLSTGVFGGGVIVFLGLSVGELIGSVIGGIGVIAMLGGILQALIFYKCPNCKSHFNIRGRKPDYCPSCGCKLDL